MPGLPLAWAPSAAHRDFSSCDLAPCLPAPVGQLADTCAVPSAAITQALLETLALVLGKCPPFHGILGATNHTMPAPGPSHRSKPSVPGRSPEHVTDAQPVSPPLHLKQTAGSRRPGSLGSVCSFPTSVGRWVAMRWAVGAPSLWMPLGWRRAGAQETANYSRRLPSPDTG